MPAGPGGDRFGRVGVRAFGRDWLLRDVPAIDWIMGASSHDLAGIFPGLVSDVDARAAVGLWLSGSDDLEIRHIRTGRVALERAGRREWTWTYNLIQECLGSWTIVNGTLVRQGVRADSENLADWLDAAYTMMRELYATDKDAHTAFENRLKAVPKDALGTMTPKMSGRAALLEFAAP
jgi:hypothetical protein